MRYLTAFTAAALVTLGLFWLMQWLIAPPEGREDTASKKPAMRIVQMDKPPEPEKQAQADAGGGSSAPEGPPPVPGLDRPSGIEVPVPEADANAMVPEFDFEPELSASGGLGESFGGFAGSGGGSGGGSGTGHGSDSGAGYGGGRDLVPLATARPQIPREACNRGIEGWAIAKFNVTPKGRVTNVRVVDAQPRGVFEKPMIKSLQHWVYEATGGDKAYQVEWKFEFKLDDCKLNWNVDE